MSSKPRENNAPPGGAVGASVEYTGHQSSIGASFTGNAFDKYVCGFNPVVSEVVRISSTIL